MIVNICKPSSLKHRRIPPHSNTIWDGGSSATSWLIISVSIPHRLSWLQSSTSSNIHLLSPIMAHRGVNYVKCGDLWNAGALHTHLQIDQGLSTRNGHSDLDFLEKTNKRITPNNHNIFGFMRIFGSKWPKQPVPEWQSRLWPHLRSSFNSLVRWKRC